MVFSFRSNWFCNVPTHKCNVFWSRRRDLRDPEASSSSCILAESDSHTIIKRMAHLGCNAIT